MTFFGLFGRIPCVRRRVICNLSDDHTAVQGVLYEVRGSWLVLKNASLLSAGGKPVDVDGDVLVDRQRVLFIQVLP